MCLCDTYTRTRTRTRTHTHTRTDLQDDNGTWHLFHAQFANHCGIYSHPGGWTNNSFVARSVSTTGQPEGPYQFVTRVIPAFAHNPEVHRDPADGSYVIFFIGGWSTSVGVCNETATVNSSNRSTGDDNRLREAHPWRRPPPAPNCTAPNWPKSCGSDMPGPSGDLCGPCRDKLNGGCGLSVATAATLAGPWITRPVRIINQWASDEVYCAHTNPSVQPLGNGSWVMAFNAGECQGHEAVGTAISDTGPLGPWRLLSRNAALRNADGTMHHCEDPFIWKSARGWHLLVHNYQVPPAGLSAYGFSVDGRNWNLSTVPPYNWTIEFTDGTRSNLTKYERPKLIFDESPGRAPLFLINGARSANPWPGDRMTWTMIRPLKRAAKVVRTDHRLRFEYHDQTP